MTTVVVFDADNTLWDTNAVFRHAQLSLLRELSGAGLLTDPEAEFDTLRALDRELVSQLGRFEYDFRLLSAAAAGYYSERATIQDAVRTVVERATNSSSADASVIIDNAYHAYEQALKSIPPLYADTRKVLTSIRELRCRGVPIASILFSEGDVNRLGRILREHEIQEHGFFDEVIIGVKSAEAFRAAKQAGMRHLRSGEGHEGVLAILIGDSLRRDVAFGNQAGFVTVYKPALFFGVETPRTPQEEPRHCISSLGELTGILRSLGVTS